ncbi:hypothetical protein P692DRAFT_201719827, partial [Suillus brevipes Sb2]
LLQESNNTFYMCKHQGKVELKVVHVKTFLSVMSMIPHMLTGEERFYMLKKPEFNLTNLGGIARK